MFIFFAASVDDIAVCWEGFEFMYILIFPCINHSINVSVVSIVAFELYFVASHIFAEAEIYGWLERDNQAQHTNLYVMVIETLNLWQICVYLLLKVSDVYIFVKLSLLTK